MSPASESETESWTEQFYESENETEPDQTPTHLTPSQLELWFELTEWIINAQGPTYHEKLNISPEVGYEVAKTLCDKGAVESRNPTVEYNPLARRLSIRMCSNPRASVTGWVDRVKWDALDSGFFTFPEFKEFFFMFNDGFYDFLAPYEMAYKDGGGPLFRYHTASPHRSRFPSVAFETGHESWTNLLEVNDLWIQGGAPHVNAVLLVKWDERDNGEVAGSLELHRRDGRVGSRIEIFSVPAPDSPHAAQAVTFYRRDFYLEGMVPDGRDPNDVWNWDLDQFREIATRTMAIDGHRPAQA